MQKKEMTYKEKYWNYTLVAIIILLGFILFDEFRPFLGGILGAFTVYILIRKQLFFLTEKKHWKPALAAGALLMEVILIFLIPLSLAVWMFIVQIQGVNLDTGELITQIEHLSDLVREKTTYNILDKENLAAVLAILPKIGQMLMSGISGFVINVFMLVLTLYFMLSSGRKMEEFFHGIMPFNDTNKREVLREMNLLVKANALGVPLLAIIQGIIAFIGYLIFGTPSPIVFAFLTCFATIIPLVGTGIIWFPLSLYLALGGDWVNAIGLLAYSLIILTNVDNVIRFILQKRLADTHPLITIFGVIIGLSLFGFMGVIFGPILLAGFFLCIKIFKTEYLDGKSFTATPREPIKPRELPFRHKRKRSSNAPSHSQRS